MTGRDPATPATESAALDSLLAALARVEQERDDWKAQWETAVEDIALVQAAEDAAEARAARAEEALRRVKQNADAWHGNEGLHTGHDRALHVISKWCDAVLAAVDEPPPGWCFKCKRQFGMFDTCGDDNCPSVQAVDEPPPSEPEPDAPNVGTDPSGSLSGGPLSKDEK